MHTSIDVDDRTVREVTELIKHFGYTERKRSQVYQEAIHDLYKRTFQEPENPLVYQHTDGHYYYIGAKPAD